MSGSSYVPDRGDVIRLDFNPQAGHEQAGGRLALVVSPAEYNGKVGLALVMPITGQAKATRSRFRFRPVRASTASSSPTS